MSKLPIPPSCYSFENNQPFENCLVCNGYLLDGRMYVIEKAFRKYPGYKVVDTIFDYAICMECAESLQREVSVSSANKINNYFTNNMHPDFLKQQGNNFEERAARCCITGKNIEDLEEYQFVVFCKGDGLLESVPSFVVSHEVVDELVLLLSDQTKDLYDHFYKTHYSPDSDLVSPPPFILF